MKRVLITGEGSYIGTSVEKWLLAYNRESEAFIPGRPSYQTDTISIRGEAWKDYDFSSYDTVFHVAGIAHADVMKASEVTKKLYYRVNCDLALETAKKARRQGVKQFIYMSSIIVYGESAPVGKSRTITGKTKPKPANFYGASKLKAEKQLLALSDERFRVAILRPPMIYGKNSKGNYSLLAKTAGILPIFPDIKNERSMLYVENLGEFVRLLMESGEGGIFYPQNREYTTTSQMVRAIAEVKGKKIRLCPILNGLVYLGAKVPGSVGRMVNKAFGSLKYDREMSRKPEGYQLFSLKESIERTES